MSAATAYVNPYGLPWASTPDLSRFRRILSACIALIMILSVLMPWLPVPQDERKFEPKPVESTMQILIEQPIPIVMPPPEVRPPKPMPKVEKPVEKKPVIVPAVKDPVPVVKKEVTREATVSHAREKAAVSGLLQFKDSFADMRDAVDVNKLSDTGAVRRGSGTAATLDRSMLTSKHGTRSAGVNLGALSRDTGGVALSGRETTKVDVPEGTVGNGGVKAGSSDDPNGSVDAHGRSIEDIRRVFDANKGAIFAIYNRALRQNPALKGQLVIELVIDPSGQVVDCRAVSSEIADEGVVAKIISRIRLFDFGQRDVALTRISYPVHFLPT